MHGIHESGNDMYPVLNIGNSVVNLMKQIPMRNSLLLS